MDTQKITSVCVANVVKVTHICLQEVVRVVSIHCSIPDTGYEAIRDRTNLTVLSLAIVHAGAYSLPLPPCPSPNPASKLLLIQIKVGG